MSAIIFLVMVLGGDDRRPEPIPKGSADSMTIESSDATATDRDRNLDDGTIAGTCPAAGDCCSSHSTPGCDDFLCCDVVCNRMPFCCEGLWSNACAEIALAVCGVCETPYVCPQPGDCCTGRFFTAGCERSACCRTVCTLDEFCCIGEWDEICARKARENCHNVCNCEMFGDFDDTASIDLLDVAMMQNCFSGDGSGPIDLSCACADYDGDADADLFDAAQFVQQFSDN